MSQTSSIIDWENGEIAPPVAGNSDAKVRVTIEKFLSPAGITARMVADNCHISDGEASALLDSMVSAGQLRAALRQISRNRTTKLYFNTKPLCDDDADAPPF